MLNGDLSANGPPFMIKEVGIFCLPEREKMHWKVAHPA